MAKKKTADQKQHAFNEAITFLFAVGMFLIGTLLAVSEEEPQKQEETPVEEEMSDEDKKIAEHIKKQHFDDKSRSIEDVLYEGGEGGPEDETE